MSATDPVLSVELGARPIRVLLLEDEPGDAALVEAMLRDAGLEGEIMWVATIADAVTALQEHRVDCILCDLGLPDGRGIDALDRVLEASGSVPVVVLTGHTEDRLGSLAVHRGAADYLRKGRVDADLLRRAVTYALGRRQVTDRLRESEERFRALFDNAPLGQLCLSLDGLVVAANAAAAAVCQRDPKAMIGRGIDELVHAADASATAELRHMLVDGDCDASRGELELRFLTPTRDVVPVRLVLSLVRDGRSDPTHFVALLEDLSEQRKAEADLRVLQERYEGIVETTQEGIWVVDAAARTIYANDRMGDILGYRPEEMVGRSLFTFMEPDDRRRALQSLNRRREGLSEQHEFPFRHKNGTQVWTLLSTSPLVDEAGAFGGGLMLVHDITDRKLAEEALRDSEARLRAVMAETPVCMFTFGHDGVCTFIDGGALQGAGLSREELLGVSLFDRYRDRPEVPDAMRRALAGEDVALVTQLHDRAWEVVYRPVRGPGGRVNHVIAVASDVTERLVADQALRESEQRFRALIEHLSDVITVVDGGGLVRFISPSARWILGHEDVSTIIGGRLRSYIHPDDFPLVEAAFRSWRSSDRIGDAVEHRVAHADGTWRHVESVGINRLDDPAVGGIVITTRDITERKEAERQLGERALLDPLTGLPNRALFYDRVAQALAARARRGTMVAVLFLDVDRFKVINDSLGHVAGDEALRAVGALLEAAVRPGDTVARLGGDEFAVCCEEIDDPLDAIVVAERLQERLRAPFGISGRELHLTLSIGIAVSGPGATASEHLVRCADAAMYRAKERGRARYEVFDENIRAEAIDRLDLEAALHAALENDELRLHYQPSLSLATGEVEGCEALVRWDRPGHGLVPPASFIPIAEETSLIVDIGTWVLREACRQLVAWRAQAPELRPLTLSVNLSARQLQRSDLVDVVASVLADTGLDPAALCLEITETVLMEDAASTIETLHALRDLGVRLAVDDFGTGYSSLRYLRRFPVEVLKIDRSFVDGLGREHEDTSIVQAVISLAQSLGLETIAEGVEHPGQLAELEALGCDMAQGYLWSKPLPPDELLRWVATHSGTAVGGSAAAAGGGGRSGATLAPARPRVANRGTAAPTAVDALTLQAVNATTRRLLHIATPEEAVGALIALVRRLGATVVPARVAGEDALPVDLSFGEGEPLLPVAEPVSVARLRLEQILPSVMEDARTAIQRLRRVSRVESAAGVDPLTGLANRRGLPARLAEAAVGDVIAMLDLDAFKEANDVLGHELGDLVLRSFSRLVREHIRAGDHAVRYDGDRFVLVLGHTSPQAADGLLARLRSRWPEVRPGAVTFSAGVAAVGAGGGEEALRRAQAALDAAKRAGRGRTELSQR